MGFLQPLMGFLWPSSLTLITELSPWKLSEHNCALNINIAFWITFQITFTLGYMMVPAFAYFIRDHNKLQLLAAAPPLIFFIVC